MDKKREKKISKALSYWLRHKPEAIGIELDEKGWTEVSILLDKSTEHIDFDIEDLKFVVENNSKQRFAFNEDYSKIKANQGHSVDVNLELQEVKPPNILFHGAPNGVVDEIMKTGLKRMNRHHVHLSPDEETAAMVGSRRGKYTILRVEAMKLRADGHKIYMSDNGVYLVDEVPPQYIKLPKN